MTRKRSILSLSVYFVLSFIIMYGLVGLGKLGIMPTDSPLFMLLFIVGSWGPTIAAILALLITEKGKGIGNLFRGWGRWKVGIGWYGAALSPFAVALLVAFIYLVIMGRPAPGPQTEITVPVIAMSLMMALLTGATGEEPGWRAFATPRLQHHLGALGASVILGIIWILWHLPLWFLEDTPQYGMPFVPFAVSCVTETILLTWIFNNTRGSLAMASLFHLSINISGTLVAGMLGWVAFDQYLWIQAVVLIVFAVLVICFFGDAKLSRKPASEMPFEKIDAH
ncbi:CPBP family intramembrane metalloprotease [candidate division WOR-3 bacterium]|uniref:CPBP family intramembrane metalloprotease n=1 Tax=candidate division WOR-3 bacterium TaxID=2052148 RepID=A0A9D5QDT6_UNCW3|nr:CPBP family intramembrane metalloprotease [candidate division WOR-3 bacterium]MBD3364380.1 CPBP family intramembrane metalloprotease [candidate division WOR-3 bacterium]